MGEQAYKAISLFRVLIFTMLAGSVVSICFHLYIIINKDYRGAGLTQMIIDQGRRLWEDDLFELYAGAGGLVLFIIALIIFGMLITLAILMMISSREEKGAGSDRILGGIMVLYSVIYGLMGFLPLHRLLLFGGLSLFLRKQLPQRFERKNILAFILVTTGSLILTLAWASFFLFNPKGLVPVIGILSTLLTISGLIIYLIIIDTNTELPIPPERKGPRLRHLPKTQRKSSKLRL